MIVGATNGYAGGRMMSRRTGGSVVREIGVEELLSSDATIFFGSLSSIGTSSLTAPFLLSLDTQSGNMD